MTRFDGYRCDKPGCAAAASVLDKEEVKSQWLRVSVAGAFSRGAGRDLHFCSRGHAAAALKTYTHKKGAPPG